MTWIELPGLLFGSSNDGHRGLHLVNWNTITCPRSHGGLGLREARLSNTAMLGKLVWCLANDRQKLWVKMMKPKYLKKGDIFAHSPPYEALFTWRSIYKAFVQLKDGYMFRVGSGDSSFWFDTWMEGGPLCTKVNFVNITDSNLRIKDVWQDGFWNLHEPYTMIPDWLKHHINNIRVEIEEGVQDCRIWLLLCLVAMM